MAEDLCRDLESLKLPYLANNLDAFIAAVTAAKSPPLSIIEQLVRHELKEAKQKTLETRLNASKVNSRKWRSIADFDWSWPTKIDRAAVERLFELHFLSEPANAVFLGPSSVGKSMLARNLAFHAVMKGYQTLFVEASALLSDLENIDSPRLLSARLKYYARPKLLVIDELGYLSSSSRAGDLLFQLINQRYEKVATVITTNVNFKDWGTIFPQVACVSAMLERLLHRAEIISIEGASYRMKEAKARGVRGSLVEGIEEKNERL